MSRLFQAVSVLLTLAIVAVPVLAVAGVDAPRGESTYSGQVVDLENEKGLIATTQVHVKTNPQASSHETFCVHPDSRAEHFDVLREAATNGDRITITYDRPLVVPLWECKSGTSIIRDVQVAR